MNDLEERLRADLLHAVEPIDGDVDADVLLESAHRALATRRSRRAVAVVALSLVGGLAAWAGVSLTALRGTAPVVATPAPVPSATASGSVEPTRSQRDWPGHSSSVTLDTHDLPGLAGTGMQMLSVQFRGEPGSDVVVTATSKAGAPISRSGAVAPNRPFLAKLTDATWVMVTPGRVRWAEGASGDGLSGAYVQQLEGLGVIVAMAEPQQKLKGFIWQGVDGKAWNDSGERAPSAELRLDGRTYWFAHDSALGVACSGVLRVGQSEGYPDECGAIENLGESGGGGSDEDGWQEELFVALPDGATGVSVDASEQCTSATSPLDPAGGTVVLLLCKGALDEAEAGFPVIRYRDAAGVAASYAP